MSFTQLRLVRDGMSTLATLSAPLAVVRKARASHTGRATPLLLPHPG